MASVLIIDDDRIFCDVLTRAIGRVGLNSTFCLTLTDGLKEVFSHPYELVLLDVQLPDGNGLKAIEKIRTAPSSPEVIILTGCGSPDGAESAIRWGAWDYIEKPASTEGITLPLLRALEYRKERFALRKPISLSRNRIIGDSQAINASLDLIAQAAKSEVTVLITGETGTGKELFARTLHENSARANNPFVVVDCSALPESLVESVLFGHEKGAFTGADRSQIGLIKLADGGTLFLDEVGELAPPMQKAFLRVLQEHCFRPVGAKTEMVSNFRLVAATNRNLDQMVQAGVFRSDLLYRLRSFFVDLPSLRNRPEDIKSLAMHYVTKFCEKSRIMIKGFAPDFFDILQKYDWPGNVRELFGMLQSALAVAGSEPVLYPTHLPVSIRAKVARNSIVPKDIPESGTYNSVQEQVDHKSMPVSGYRDFREKVLDNAERDYFSRIVFQAEGDVKAACRLSGLSRSRLYHFLQKHSLSILKSNPSGKESTENQD
jgi:two-component system, NtrC family, response regulator